MYQLPEFNICCGKDVTVNHASIQWFHQKGADLAACHSTGQGAWSIHEDTDLFNLEASDTDHKSTDGRDVDDVAKSGSNDEVSGSMTKPTKVTRQLIEMAQTSSQTQLRSVTNKSTAVITSTILPGKLKLKLCTVFESKHAKESKYQLIHNQEKPADSLGQQEHHAENVIKQCCQASLGTHYCNKNCHKHSSRAFTPQCTYLSYYHCKDLPKPSKLAGRFSNSILKDFHSIAPSVLWHTGKPMNVYEWHAHIAKVSIDAIKNMWILNPKYENPKKYKAYMEFTLGPSLPFMYGKIKYIGVKYYKGCASLSSHIVKHALTINSTGVKKMPGKRSEASFSDVVWGMKALWYTQSILKISKGKFDQILDGAQKSCNAVVQSRQAQVSQHILTMGIVDDMDILDDHCRDTKKCLLYLSTMWSIAGSVPISDMTVHNHTTVRTTLQTSQ
ncbi:hypothetical protein HD554DRAFT_2041711 [Boletus coccyginus]|nr:hypothetical protein HD554DRAFT_2041711 [Boletus coccyginus]